MAGRKSGFQEEVYAVRHGANLVSKYGRRDQEGALFDGGAEDPNHLLGAFPVLFPYGRGGFEITRVRPLSYQKHARYALRYFDFRFRRNIAFVCQLFSVLQRREVATHSRLTMARHNWNALEPIMNRITAADLRQASQEQQRRQKLSNPDVQALWKQVTATRTRVMATDECRSSYRSKIWSMVVAFNPPLIWLTLNPSDTHDPIAQVFAGKEIDMDNSIRLEGLTPAQNTDRARTVASDPLAATEFFFYIVNAVLEELFGIQVGRGPQGVIRRRRGILGTVQGYFGTVEAQGRGALHVHMLLWIRGSPPAAEMKELFKSDEFRTRLIAYLDTIIHAHEDKLTAEAIEILEAIPAVAYNQPPDPSQPNFQEVIRQELPSLIRTVQVSTHY